MAAAWSIFFILPAEVMSTMVTAYDRYNRCEATEHRILLTCPSESSVQDSEALMKGLILRFLFI
jgi:hypothetical protein